MRTLTGKCHIKGWTENFPESREKPVPWVAKKPKNQSKGLSPTINNLQHIRGQRHFHTIASDLLTNTRAEVLPRVFSFQEGQLKQAWEYYTVRYAIVTNVAGWACSEFRHEVLLLDTMVTEH